MSLTDAKIRTLKPSDKPFKVSDSHGLYLLVKPGGSRHWYLKYRISGKESRIALGAYPAISLSDARQQREGIRKMLALNINPVQQRAAERGSRTPDKVFKNVALAGYLFDYVTRIYTDLLAQGNQAAVEFMPFVCSVAYIVFVLRVSAEERTRGQLEQTRNNLKLQVGQAVREIEALRTSQQQTRAYRHDLRHHLQYISACIENGRGEQAQEYIQSICSEIEASKVTTYCENEAANLIFSSFAGRAESCGVPLNIQAHIPQLISVAETDLCVLLSNALENALRACRRMKAENGPAYIEVTAREKNGHLFLQFVNPCPETNY